MTRIKKIAVPFSILVAFALNLLNPGNAAMSSNNISSKPQSINRRIINGTIKSNIKKYKWIQKTSTNSDLRKFPYPYKAMLAISSDIDDTTLEEFEAYHRYLNTRKRSVYGKGLGLDIGDSFWIFMGSKSGIKTDAAGNTMKDVMTFCEGLNPSKFHNADKILRYINCGWIDSIHTFGNFSTTPNSTLCTREYAIKAWNLMKRYGIHPTVWINHGTATNHQNFGSYGVAKFFRYQNGDIPGSKYYNTDITIKNGIHYIWDSIASSIFGVDYPMYMTQLNDGQKVWGFHRFTRRLLPLILMI